MCDMRFLYMSKWKILLSKRRIYSNFVDNDLIDHIGKLIYNNCSQRKMHTTTEKCP